MSGQRQVHRVKKEGDKSEVVSAEKERQLVPMTILLQRLFPGNLFLCRYHHHDEEKI